jgi:hypothetical protein
MRIFKYGTILERVQFILYTSKLILECLNGFLSYQGPFFHIYATILAQALLIPYGICSVSFINTLILPVLFCSGHQMLIQTFTS